MIDWDAVEWGSVANCVSGLGSIFASCVALYLAGYARRIRLRAHFGHRLLLGGGGPRSEVIAIGATNIGQRATVVSNIGLRYGLFKKHYGVITIVQTAWSHGIPKELPDGSEGHWHIPLDSKKTWLSDLVRNFVKSRLDIETLYASIHTTNGGTTYVRAEKGLRKMLIEELKKQGMANNALEADRGA